MTLLLLACTNTGSVELGPSTTDSGDPGGDTGEDVFDPSGSYEGDLTVDVYWDVWDYDARCDDNDVEVVVDGDEVQGTASCTFDWDDGDSMTFRVTFDGSLDDDLGFEGDAVIDLNDFTREDESDASGSFAEGSARVQGDGDMTAYGETMDYAWELELAPE